MNIQSRLHKLEAVTSIAPSTGRPVRPFGLTDSEYEQAIADKRRELGLTPQQTLPILALTGYGATK